MSRPVQHMDGAAVCAALPWAALIDRLGEAFAHGCVMPLRHHHTLALRGEPDATLLLMPAWSPGGYLGVKVATVFPGNARRGLGSVHACYQLYDATSGEPLAVIDGDALTLRRTAATSALAARFLARSDASRLLMVGTGRLSRNLVAAHASVRPIREVEVWGRNRVKADEVAADLGEMLPGVQVRGVTDLAGAVRRADVISCATLAHEPLLQGDWLQPGVHVDLVGGYTPQMREADDGVVRRACIYVDNLAGAMHEAGDLAQPLAAGVIGREAILGDLAALCRGELGGREDDAQITLYKSVGCALEDLAAAVLAVGGQWVEADVETE